MSQNEKQPPTACVPVSTRGAQCPKSVPERLLALQDAASNMQRLHKTARPDTRSPLDPWHEEAYLIRCLVRMHGWAQPEAGMLRRFRRA
jgi:hypothetical protein